MRASRTTILYIAGSGRSCTTLLGHILGQVKGFCFVGEAMYAGRALDNKRCGCRTPLAACEFWNRVRRKAAGEQPPEPSEFFGLGRIARWRHLPLTLLRDRERRLESRYGRHWHGSEQFYETVATLAGAEVIVDSSKSVPYARMLDLLPALDLRVVHLVRDARAVAHSRRRWKPAPDKLDVPYMGRRGSVRSAVAWNISNVGTELFCRAPERYLRLRYEDFAERPRESVDRILRMVTDRPLPLPFVDDRTVMLGPTHSIKGNADRLQVGPVEIKLDDQWKTTMVPRERRLVTALTWPLLARYGYL